jgi:hypothetical protein
MRFSLCLAGLLAIASLAGAAPQDAVVKLKSLGGSGTVIKTIPPSQQFPQGKSWILSAAHMARQGPRITVDAPDPNPGQPVPVNARIVAVNREADLMLVTFDKQLPYVCPVAPPNNVPGRLLSVGYDDLKWPQVQRTAHMLGTPKAFTYTHTLALPDSIPADTLGTEYTARAGDEANFTLTQELPWHGRSGGALIDLDHGVLVGVVSGYRGATPRSWAEVKAGASGVYTSHRAVLAFLQTNAPECLQTGEPAPRLTQPPYQEYLAPAVPGVKGAAPVVIDGYNLPDGRILDGAGRGIWQQDQTGRWVLTPLMPPAQTQRGCAPGGNCPPGVCGPDCPCPPGSCPSCERAQPRPWTPQPQQRILYQPPGGT